MSVQCVGTTWYCIAVVSWDSKLRPAGFNLDDISAVTLLRPSCARRVPQEGTDISLTASKRRGGVESWNRLSRRIQRRFSGRPTAVLGNHRVSLACSATLILRVCDLSARSPTSILATTQVVDANGVRSSRGPVPRSVRTARGVGSQPSLRRGASCLQGKRFVCCLLYLQFKRFSCHTSTNASTYYRSRSSLVWWTAVRCRRGKRIFCALEFDRVLYTRHLFSVPDVVFVVFACRRCFLPRFS